jgi:hypothetical protein
MDCQLRINDTSQTTERRIHAGHLPQPAGTGMTNSQFGWNPTSWKIVDREDKWYRTATDEQVGIGLQAGQKFLLVQVALVGTRTLTW